MFKTLCSIVGDAIKKLKLTEQELLTLTPDYH
jgi:hypothetical protein